MPKALGRPRKILDEQKISRFIGKGFTVEYVAEVMGCHADTLYANYSEALRKGYAFRNGCLQAKQFQSAMVKNNPVMQIWLGKQWLKQADKQEVDVRKQVVQLVVGIDQSKLNALTSPPMVKSVSDETHKTNEKEETISALSQPEAS